MDLRYEIIFESPDFLAVSKPSGMLSIPDREGKEISLKQLLKDRFGEIYTVHRLDRDTSGLILFARNQAWHQYLNSLFEERGIDKTYVGVVVGACSPEEGIIEAPMMEDPAQAGRMLVHRKGKFSKTGYKVTDRHAMYSMVEFQLYTGRTHQIRVHMQHLGFPLVCDTLYGDGQPVLVSGFKKKYKLSKNQESERPLINRLGLHAFRLTFLGPDGSAYNLESPIPKEFAVLMKQLHKYG